MEKHFTSFTLAAALLCVPLANAASIAVETFEDENTGDLNGQGAGSDGGFTGNWSALVGSPSATVQVVSSTLSYSNGAVGSSGGSQALQLTFTDNSIVGNVFSRAFSPAETGTIYLSFLYREVTNPDFGTDFIQVGFENTAPDQPLASILRRNGTYQVRSGTSSTANGTQGTTPADVGITHLLVLKAEKTSGGTYNRVSLFIDPDSLTEPGSPTSFSTANSGLATAGLLTARTAFHATGDTVQLDNILIGTSWGDVVTAIPEPSASALIGLAGMACLLRRRRTIG
jgi:hypothetical protein